MLLQSPSYRRTAAFGDLTPRDHRRGISQNWLEQRFNRGAVEEGGL